MPKIAEALARFPGSAPFRSFQARQGSGLEQANDALKAFAEAAYRAVDYVRLHGQTAGMLDGGPLLNDGALRRCSTISRRCVVCSIRRRSPKAA